MFRISGAERPDLALEKKKIREAVISNVIIFAALIISYRIGE